MKGTLSRKPKKTASLWTVMQQQRTRSEPYYTSKNEVGFSCKQHNLLTNEMAENCLLEERFSEKIELHLSCIEGDRIQNRWNFHFRASYILERYISAISLDKKMPCPEEKQTYFLRVYARHQYRRQNKRT